MTRGKQPDDLAAHYRRTAEDVFLFLAANEGTAVPLRRALANATVACEVLAQILDILEGRIDQLQRAVDAEAKGKQVEVPEGLVLVHDLLRVIGQNPGLVEALGQRVQARRRAEESRGV